MAKSGQVASVGKKPIPVTLAKPKQQARQPVYQPPTRLNTIIEVNEDFGEIEAEYRILSGSRKTQHPGLFEEVGFFGELELG